MNAPNRHEGVKYNEKGIPVLELPEAIPVRPPKYHYSQYEEEHRHWIKGRRGEAAWRLEQRRRWKDGHAGLSGIHYFYLTQMKIKDAEGNLIRPMWRDVDEIILNDYLECLADERDLYVFKRREIGLSSLFGGLIPIYTAIMNPGSTSIMTSADLGRVTDLLSEKFIAQHGALEDWVQPKRTNYDQREGRVALAEMDEDGNQTGNVARVMCRQTSQKPSDVTNLEGARAKYAFLDELFLHPYPEKVRGSVESCLLAGQKRVGIMVSGGSAGSVSRLGLREAKQIWESGASGTVKCLFLSGALGITEATIRDENGKKIGVENFCVNGWSDTARADAYIKWQRAILDLKPNKEDYLSYIKRYPLDIKEIFKNEEVGVIPEDIAQMIPAQEMELENNPRNLRKVRFDKDATGKVTFTNDPNGAWLISEEPVKGRTYEMGTDTAKTLMTKEESTMDPNGTERSMNCAVIKCVETDSYVGIYLRRTSDEKLLYREISLAQKAYNDCQNMVERNTADVLYLMYKYDNNLDALAYQPKWIGSKDWKKNKTRGVWKGGGNEDKLYTAMFGYFRNYMHNVDFPVILEQLKVFGIDNTDVIDAMVMCEVLSKGREITDGQRAIAAMQMRYREVPYVAIEHGKRVVKYRKEPISGPPKQQGGMQWEAVL